MIIIGKIVSQKKEELDHILDQFNIQVDNPVAILNQDTSRNFLHSKNATDKYMVGINYSIYENSSFTIIEPHCNRNDLIRSLAVLVFPEGHTAGTDEARLCSC